jgi:Fe-S-cluster containining protein
MTSPRDRSDFACRPGCGACCIAPSISTPLPKMPEGKPAGTPCAHLDGSLRCELFGRPERPAVCGGLQASPEMCGETREQAIAWLARLERLTAPHIPGGEPHGATSDSLT